MGDEEEEDEWVAGMDDGDEGDLPFKFSLPAAGNRNGQDDNNTDDDQGNEYENSDNEPNESQSASQDPSYRPLSFAEKEILKTQRKIREIEKIEEAIASNQKLEKNQLAKVQKKNEIMEKLYQLEQRSRNQGGRTLKELDSSAEKNKRGSDNSPLVALPKVP